MKSAPRQLSVAPMMDWTDRHCRFFHRQISHHTWLYTEMVTTGALLHGDVPCHLDFDEFKHPVALQLGGGKPGDLAQATRLGQQWSYKEINLNCDCPSEHVQRGAFGACLMVESKLVAQDVKVMRDAVSIPVTVKHRIGIDAIKTYDFVCDFVGTIVEAGRETFIVYACNAILKGLGPKENREILPLCYEVVYQLRRDFPYLEILLSGGVQTLEQIDAHLARVDGVMIGHEAYHHPHLMAAFDTRYYSVGTKAPTRAEVEDAMIGYVGRWIERGGYAGAAVRHILGLYRGVAGARGWWRVLSDSKALSRVKMLADAHALLDEARAHLRRSEESNEEAVAV